MGIKAKEAEIDTIRRMGIFRPTDLESCGISKERLYSLVRKGMVERLSRGVYVARNHTLTAEHAVAHVDRGTSCIYAICYSCATWGSSQAINLYRTEQR